MKILVCGGEIPYRLRVLGEKPGSHIGRSHRFFEGAAVIRVVLVAFLVQTGQIFGNLILSMLTLTIGSSNTSL